MKSQYSIFSKLFTPISRGVHAYPKVSLVILAVFGIGIGTLGAAFWGGSGSSEGVMYTTDTVQKGTIETSVSGTGQVVAGKEVELKSDANADIVYVGAAVGDVVKKGTLLIQMDYTEAQKSVRDAEMSLEEAQISYDKLVAPLTELESLSADHSLSRAEESVRDAESNLSDAYDDAYITISDTFLDVPTIMTGLDDILYSKSLNGVQENIDAYRSRVERSRPSVVSMRNDVNDMYDDARVSYEDTFDAYDTLSRTSSDEDIAAVLNETYDMVEYISDAVREANNYIDYVDDAIVHLELQQFPLTATHQNTLDGYVNTLNGHINAVSSAIRAIENAKDTLTDAERNLEEEQLSYTDTQNGPDALDIRSAELSLIRKQNALADAKEALSDYFVYAPIDGVIAAMNVVAGDSVYSVSSESNLGTIITSEQMAEITLNEVDAADVSTGQRATLTFDALPGIEVEGEVVEVDTIGTATQGVVTYGVKIAFDAEETGVKTGMSVNASIKTAFEENVLSVSSSAITIENGVSYVNVVSGMPGDTLYEKKEVVTGMSDDVRTEIISGLSEGDVVRIGTTVSSTESSSTQG